MGPGGAFFQFRNQGCLAVTDKYNDRLQAIRDAGAWEPWLKFFLQGVHEVSLEATGTARRIMQMREQHRELIVANLGKRTDRGLKLLESLFDVPVVTGTSVEKHTGLSTPNANALIQSLVTLGLLKEVTGRERRTARLNRLWIEFSPTPTREGVVA